MPSLAQLTDAYLQPDTGLPVEPLYVPNKEDAISVRPVVDDRPEPMPEIVGNLDEPTFSKGTKFGNKLFGLNGEERYQTWPEKLLRSGLTAPGDALSGQLEPFGVDPVTGDVHTSPQMIERAQDMAALSGTGGLAGADATLGSAPFLRPALKYENKIYKAPLNGQHLDALPSHLAEEFNRQAMSGEDISNFNFGFMNHKGQFLDRQAALDYAIKEGLVDPHAGQYGALTSTLLADSSKPGTAIEAMAKTNPRKYMEIRNAIEGGDPNYVYHVTNSERADQIANEGLKTHKPHEFTDQSVWPDGTTEKRNYFTSTPKNSWQFAPEEGKPALLRVKKDSHEFKTEPTGDIYSKKAVAPNKIEYLNDEGKWVSLKSDNEAGAGIAAMKQAIKQPFYSALEHNVDKITQSKMTGDQWLGTLANKPGVKPEELQWTGTQDFLKERGNQPVTKAELQEHLQGNKVELKEVNKAARDDKNIPQSELDDAAKELYGKNFDDLPNGQKLSIKQHIAGIDTTKYKSYQLPGGENYREMLLTLPGKNQNPGSFSEFAKAKGYSDEQIKNSFDNDPVYKEWKSKQEDFRTADKYKSSHWEEPNILAHVRMNDRSIEGKKSLHLEEIQSDWHQQGRDKGYKENIKPLSETQVARAKELNEKAQAMRDGGMSLEDVQKSDIGKELLKLKDQHQAFIDQDRVGQVPDAPFKKSWHELALKRMIREAAEKGYDRLSWTPGEAQAARYDLSKSVSKVEYLPGSKELYAFDKNGNKVLDKKVEPENIADHIGKDAAKKLLQTKDKSGTINRLEGQDLKIGGDGMKGFYDQIIPKAIEKIGKEHGVKVKQGSVEYGGNAYGNKYGWEKGDDGRYHITTPDGRTGTSFATRQEAQHEMKSLMQNKTAQPIHYIDIPQSLRDTAMHKGFPLFSGGYQFIPVVGNPFEDKKK